MASFAIRKDDLYETPAQAVYALLQHFPIDEPVWEPCAGRGAISRILTAAGHKVYAQDLVHHYGADADIVPMVDFLMEYRAPTKLIITNPPYKLADNFVRHGLHLGCRFVALLRLAAIEGVNRSDIMSKCSHIYAGIERLPMMHRDGYDGVKTESNSTPFAWFVFDPNFNGNTILKRISWRVSKDGPSMPETVMNL